MNSHRHSLSRGSVFSYLLVTLLVTSALVLTSCSGSSDGDRGGSSSQPAFAVNPDYLGEPYSNEELGITFRPPRDWLVLDAETRTRVMEAIRGESGIDAAELIDVFFSTETISFAVLQRALGENGQPISVADYDVLLGEALEPGDDPARVTASERSEFEVNDLDVIHYRHIVADRVGASLLFSGADGMAVVLQYSIPDSAIDTELPKVESSIGTLRRLR
jgi:hypothetical protein